MVLVVGEGDGVEGVSPSRVAGLAEDPDDPVSWGEALDSLISFLSGEVLVIGVEVGVVEGVGSWEGIRN
jgi:hypothetical protein